jgi:predicted phage tail component-like protein
MAKFEGIVFNEILMPDFVRVLSIEHSILPPVSQNLLTISGKHGAYDYGNEIGVREIAIDIAIVMAEENTLPQYLEQLAEWLYYDEAKKLVLGDDINKYYLAKFTGDSNIQESFLVGEGTLTFVCTNPYKHGLEREFLIPETYGNGSEPFNVLNTGNAVTEPKMTFEIVKDITSFTVVADDEFIDIGTPMTVDDSRTIASHGKYAMYDQLTSTTGWTTSASVHSGTVFGTFEVYGNHAFRQSGLDFGENLTGWHGATMQKVMDFAVQDFDAVWYFRIDTSKEQLGRMHMSLLAEDGTELFMVQMYDAHANNSSLRFSARSFGIENIIGSEATFTNNTSIDGYVKLKRQGSIMYVDVYEKVSGAYKKLHSQRFMDTSGGKKVGQVKLHTGAYGSYAPAYMEQRDVVITNLDKASLNINTVPLIAVAGDVLEIDNSTGAILKNGVPFYQYLNPSSSFIKLEKGANGISISPADCFNNGVISYTEKSL